MRNRVDLDVTIATDVNGTCEAHETGREDIRIGRYDYVKIGMRERLSLTNFKNRPISVSIVKQVVGFASADGPDVKIKHLTPAEVNRVTSGNRWRSWNLPSWIAGANTLSDIEWNIDIPAGESASVEYDWFFHARR